MASERGVVITGTSTGIGAACALHLDKLGFCVFAGVRKDADGDALKQKSSGRLTPVCIDVTDAATIASAAKTVTAAVGEAGLTGLVNNAGIAVAGPLEFLPIDDVRQQLEVNVTGQLAVTQAFLPLLRLARGRIVNIGSANGRVAIPFVGLYSASKFAMEGLTDAMRMELKPWGIEVSIIEAGGIATPIWQKSTAAADEMIRNLPERAHELYGAAIPAFRKAAAREAQKAISPDIVAQAVTHALVSKKPGTRYSVGRNASLQVIIARLLPDRFRDGLILRRLGLG
ncbi:MAG: short-chain dehydrogenase/reductase [Acidobacteria bacterium]|nr:MAG: short-chain dehydrogenase/reductase [Acidobacteriota bacterium]